MLINELNLKGVFEIKLEPHEDERGFFMRTYDDKIFDKFGLDKRWVQENHSFSSKRGIVRGLHFHHSPNTETKLIRVMLGEVFFVVVDIRKDSETFGKWTRVVLSGDKKNMIYIPRGFCSGFCTLMDNCHLLYKMDNYYNPEKDDNIKWNDPELGIVWPIENPITSERDSRAQSFKEFKEKYGGL